MPHNSDYGDKFVLICEEAEICKRLSSNDIKVRRKGVSALKHLLKNIDNRKVVDSSDFSRLWNGIFNFIWMSDKLLVQEEDVESISKLIHVLKKHEMLFVREFFNSLTRQWNRISHYRTDKFLMMVRRFLRQILYFLKNSEWNSQKIESFSQELYSAVQILPLGLVLHFNDIYIEEIAKVSEGIIPTDALILLLKGYVECIVAMKPSMNIVNNINSSVFSALTRQLKLHIKQKALIAAEDVHEDAIEDEVMDELPENRALDPRPGNVDVFLPFVEFDEKKIVEFLSEYAKRATTPSKARNVLFQIISMFKSITNLRESINNPKQVMREAYSKTNKRKKRHKSIGSLIKKSCKRLEMFEAECSNTAEDRIIRKLEKMNDLIQIPVGNKLITMEKKNLGVSSKNKKGKKKSDRGEPQTWMISDSRENEGTSDAQSTNNWTISEYETNCSSILADNSQDLELALSSSVSEEQSRIVSPPGKRQSVEITSNLPSSTKSVDDANDDSAKINRKRRKLIEESESDRITPTSIKHALRSSPQKLVLGTPESPEAAGNKSNKALKSSPSPKCKKSLESKTCEDFVIAKIADTKLSDSDTPTMKKVMKKAEEGRSKILTSDSPAWITVPKDELVSWIPKDEKKKRTESEQSDEDVDYDLSALFASPPQPLSTTRKRRSSRPAVLEVKRSARLANKAAAAKIADDKKVAFTHSNSFQEVREYYSTIRSSPKNPYDASKTPVKGILKPFAVAGPINPFYFPNGQPKLLNLRKQRLQRFL